MKNGYIIIAFFRSLSVFSVKIMVSLQDGWGHHRNTPSKRLSRSIKRIPVILLPFKVMRHDTVPEGSPAVS